MIRFIRCADCILRIKEFSCYKKDTDCININNSMLILETLDLMFR